MTPTPNWLNSLPAPTGVLETVQRRGRKDLAKIGLPPNADESWRLTNLKRIEDLLKLPISATTSFESTPQKKLADLHNNSFRLILDSHNDPLSNIKDLPRGLRPLTTAELEQTLGHTLDRCGFNSNWPVAINHASTTQILALRVVEFK